MLKKIVITLCLLVNFSSLADDQLAVQPAILNQDNEAQVPQNGAQQNSVQPPSFADIVEPLIPTVVNIYTEHYAKSQRENLPPAFNHFKDLFKDFDVPFLFEDIYTNPKAVSLGSGFIIDQDGYIVTNNHVVENADKINIKLHDNIELEAKLIGTDKKTDLALLKVEASQKLPFAVFGNDQAVRVGDWVIAIGNPFGLGHSVTKGIVSSKARDIDSENGLVNNYVQTDAPINRGNSGGPLFDLSGKVIGVNTSIYSSSGSNAGVGFAIPSHTAAKVVEQLRKYGKVNRGLLNITIQQLTPEIAEGIGLSKEQKGVLVTEVNAGGAGYKAGLKSGDVILEFNGKKTTSPRELQVSVAESQINAIATIKILRNNQVKELKTLIISDENDDKTYSALKDSKSDTTSKSQYKINEVIFVNLNSQIAKQYRIEQTNGIVVSGVSKTSTWYPYLKAGDLITSVNQQSISNIEELEKIYSASKGKKNIILFMVKRRNLNSFLALPIK
jgi:serine protease Do